MKNILIALALITLAACSTKPVVEPLTSQAPDSKGLNVVSGTPFDNFYVREDASLEDYDALMFAPLELDELEINDRRLDIRDRDWTLTEKEKTRIIEDFAERAQRATESAGQFRVAEQPGPGVLLVSFEFVEFSPSASKDDGVNRGVRDDVFTRGIGGLKLNAKITDAQTGLLIAYLDDNREVGERIDLERNDRVNNTRYLRLEITSWINKLQDTLVGLK